MDRRAFIGILTRLAEPLFPVEQPAKFELVINLKTVNVLAGLAAVVAGLLAMAPCAPAEATALYVRTFGSALAVMDAANPGVLARVPLGISGSGAAVHPSGALVYAHAVVTATRTTRDERVAVIDVASRSVVATIPVATGVRQLALDPAGKFLYVGADTSLALSGIVVSSQPVVEVIDARASRRVTTVPLGPTLAGPDHAEVPALAVHPSGAKVYAARSVTRTSPSFQITDDVVILGTAPHEIVGTVSGLGAPLAVDAAGARLYARAPAGLAVVDAATDTPVTTIPLECCLAQGHLAVHPHGATVYALFPEVDGISGQIAVVDAHANALVTTIPLGTLVPRASAFHPDGSRLYVVGDAGSACQQLPCPPRAPVLAVVDTAANRVVATVALSPGPTSIAQSIAVHPAGTHVYAAFTSGAFTSALSTVAIVDTATNAVVRTFPGAEVMIGPDLPRVPGELRFHVARSSDGGATAIPWGAPGDRPVPADYDGDGRADVAVLRPAEGGEESVWYVVRSSDGGGIRQQWGAVSLGDEPVPADYDGDGRVDVAVWRPVTGEWWIVGSRDASVTRIQLGAPDAVPVPADYDGDGRADVAVWRPAFTQWSIVGSASGQLTSAQFGAPTDVPVPADYDGDGRADIAVWRPATGEWFVHLSATGTETSVAFGAPGDVPVPRDWDGDGRADFAVWRSRTGEWFILRSGDGAMAYGVWGAPGDRPVTADWDGDQQTDLAVYRP